MVRNPASPIVLAVLLFALTACGGGDRRSAESAMANAEATATSEQTPAAEPEPVEQMDPEKARELALLKAKILVAPDARYTIAGEDATFAELEAHIARFAAINRFATLTVHIPPQIDIVDTSRFMGLVERYRLTNVRITRAP